MTELRFAVFDCDGTLVDSQHHIGAAMTQAWQAEGLSAPSMQAVRAYVGLPLEVAIANMLPDHDGSVHRRVADGYRDAARDLDARRDNSAPLFDGCRAVLDRLLEQDVILGVVTGKGRRGLDQTIAEHGLENHFVVLKTADDGPGKPDPTVLLDAITYVGARPSETVMIGDTTFDIQMAVNAQALALGVNWGYHEPQALLSAGAKQVAERFEDVPGHLDMLWGRQS